VALIITARTQALMNSDFTSIRNFMEVNLALHQHWVSGVGVPDRRAPGMAHVEPAQGCALFGVSGNSIPGDQCVLRSAKPISNGQKKSRLEECSRRDSLYRL